ncbi:uncharacterized protein EDB91DRAFT_1260009 [Suillus paluster]|uniref:uncharacterized protein n=1 Tax=Suillus paluster TaxID=48578 RepID=UPI001B86963F|nr:uncharacterized protein EDB91DRAFT_1260009 [Suillus paluster]KAG1756206.1 hypothetical protein EDB91DRAFT_1260009 [Suillus paluster]
MSGAQQCDDIPALQPTRGDSILVVIILNIVIWLTFALHYNLIQDILMGNGAEEEEEENSLLEPHVKPFVEVHFRKIIDLPRPDTHNVVPNSALIVAHTVTKSNTSQYTLNSWSSTYTEVQTLLQGCRIDLTHKHFLILQGEVESIAQMKPKGTSEHDNRLLEYLEDIIGTAALADVEWLGEERAEKVARFEDCGEGEGEVRQGEKGGASMAEVCE